MRSVWSRGTLNLKPGLIRLFEWSKDFSARTQRQTHAHVWIRLLELPQEYWMDRTLREIANAIGTPLLIDSATQNRVFEHYARVLVDMDLSKHIYNEVMVERAGYSFAIEITYERLPAFCTHCRNIGHHISSCRWLHLVKETHNIDNKKKSTISQKQQDLKWQPKDNPDGIGSSKAFEAPVVNNGTAAIPLADDTTLPTQTVQTESESASDVIPDQVVDTEQHDNEAIPLSVLVVEEKTRQERLPSNSVHVLERISETAETQEDEATAATQPLFTDVMELEAHTQTNAASTEINAGMNVEIQQDDNASERVAPVLHHEIPISKNVQSDLDLWARIREYDQQMAEEGFTQVLSKKQQKDLKRQVLAKTAYNTREKGTPPPSSS